MSFEHFDDDAFDLQVIADRLGGGELAARDVARVAQIRPSSVRSLVLRGAIPKPDHYAEVRGARTITEARWTAEQVAAMLVHPREDRRRRAT